MLSERILSSAQPFLLNSCFIRVTKYPLVHNLKESTRCVRTMYQACHRLRLRPHSRNRLFQWKWPVNRLKPVTVAHYTTGWPICWRTWVGLTSIWDVPRLVGRYCSYLLPKQVGGTPQIKVNPTQVRQQMGHPVLCVTPCPFCIANAVTVLHCVYRGLIQRRTKSKTSVCRLCPRSSRTSSCVRFTTSFHPGTQNLGQVSQINCLPLN